jgi:hypothetical protein
MIRTVCVGGQNAVTPDGELVGAGDLGAGFTAFQRACGDRPDPPLVTGAMVAGLALPEALVEIEATAVVPLAAAS